MSDLLGRPISGDITKSYRSTVEQWSPEKFIELIDAVFEADPRIVGLNWHQYTPYFNDGEPCVFNTWPNEEAFAVLDKLPDYWPRYVEDDEDEEDDGVKPTFLSLDQIKGRRFRYIEGRGYDYEDVEASPAAAAVDNLVSNWDHFENMLLDSFGDHAQVTATREGFNVEFYEHD